MNDACLIEYSMSMFGDSNYYFIWYEDELGNDRLYTDGEKLLFFADKNEGMQQIQALGMLYRDTVSFDGERLSYWLTADNNEQIFTDMQLDAEFLLDFWNLFLDLAESLHTVLTEPDGSVQCYRRLFRCTSSAALLYDDECRTPEMTENDIDIIRTVLKSGEALMRRRLLHFQPDGAAR